MSLDSPIDRDAAATLLHQYSEWLDGEISVAAEPGDDRTHDDLVKQFLADRADTWLPPVKVVSERVEGQVEFGSIEESILRHAEHVTPLPGETAAEQKARLKATPHERPPLVAFGEPDDFGPGYHPRTGQKLPESLDPSARHGGGDPLADYLHQKGERP